MHDALVVKRNQDPSLVARLLCGNPAKRFGLGARKGRIALGADADFAILDPRQSFTVEAKKSYSSAKWSPYDGWTTQGRLVRTILRGRTIYRRREGRGAGRLRPVPAGPGLWGVRGQG